MNDEFDALVNETFYALMEFRPDFATLFGLHEYNKKMPTATKEAHLTFISALSEYLQKFQEISPEELSPDRQIDRKLMISTLNYHFFQEGKIRHWERDPDLSEMIGGAIFPLFSRDFAPFKERFESITARVSQFPQFIKDFRTRVKTPVKLWLDMTREACSTLPFFFQIISQTAQQKELDTTELDEAAAKTAEALNEYMGWLDTLSCEGEPILGRELFEELLKVRNLGYTADEILKVGEHYLKNEKRKLEELAAVIDSSQTVQEVRTAILQDHPPTFEDTLKEYEKAITRARETVEKTGFATIPDGERLTVMETPPFLRHIVPVAAYLSPAKFEDSQIGIYVVTPVEGDSLKEHNYASILNTSVHEAYPGHHLQFTWANKNPSLARVLSHAPEFIEGWAHYCEERMRDYGLTDPKVKFVQTAGVIFRAVRIIIDVKLHCGEMTFDEAVSFLKSEAGREEYAAVAEVKRYTKTPTYPLSYLLGKHVLLELQKDVQNHLREKYSGKDFHNTILQAGSMPFPYLREELKLKGML